jgi:hypothetical protein
MMLLKHHWLLLLALRLSLPSSASAAEVIWPGGPANDIKTLERTWFDWETNFNVFPKSVRVEIKKAPPSNKIAAHSVGNILHLGPQALREESIRTHELAHAFLFTYCPSFSREKFLSEVFAYQISGDFQRIGVNEFIFSSASAAYLNDNRSRLNNLEDFSPALARLLREKPAVEWNLFWKDLFKECSKGESEIWTEKVLANLTLPAATQAGAEGFLLLDATSGLPLVEQGNLEQLRSTGSLLKPLLVAVSSKVREPRTSRHDPIWACEKAEAPGLRKWGWPEALTHSCNGFFIDAKLASLELANAATVIQNIINRKVPATLKTEQIIGLLPGIELSARELAKIYFDLQKNHKEIVEALYETPVNGTLSGLPDSEWFRKNKIALKSGTTRDSLNRPVIGWIAAVTPVWIAIQFKVARSPMEFLGGFRDHLKTWGNLSAESAEVQILGLVPENQIELRCQKEDQAKLASELTEKESFRCPGSAILANFAMSDGSRAERTYFGEIQKSTLQLEPELTKNTTARRARARSGSSLILKTSRLSYTLEVLASEYPQGRLETLKALAVAIQSNFKTDRHRDRPLCDTTHCQVYQSNWAKLDRAAQSRILEAVLAVERERPAAKGWMPFALGGDSTWKQNRTLSQIKSLLTPKEFDGVISQKFEPCEHLRNQLSLPSCPKKIAIKGNDIIFEGRGEGHGLGIDLSAADALAAQGFDYKQILKRIK